jgi:hypothetical protein
MRTLRYITLQYLTLTLSFNVRNPQEPSIPNIKRFWIRTTTSGLNQQSAHFSNTASGVCGATCTNIFRSVMRHFKAQVPN